MSKQTATPATKPAAFPIPPIIQSFFDTHDKAVAADRDFKKWSEDAERRAVELHAAFMVADPDDEKQVAKVAQLRTQTEIAAGKRDGFQSEYEQAGELIARTFNSMHGEIKGIANAQRDIKLGRARANYLANRNDPRAGEDFLNSGIYSQIQVEAQDFRKLPSAITPAYLLTGYGLFIERLREALDYINDGLPELPRTEPQPLTV